MTSIRSRRVLIGHELRPACVVVSDGVIQRVVEWSDAPSGTNLHDFGEAVVMPGLVDSHVHINEPGRTEWEGFETATSAAAAGGVTTLLDMPLNSVPATTSVRALEVKHHAAIGRCAVNVGFLGGVVPGNSAELAPLWRAGVFAFKCFLVPSGVDEFGGVGENDLRTALPVLAALGAPLMVHAELSQYLAEPSGDPRHYQTYLASRPDRAETEAIALVVRLAREYHARVHVVHVSSADSIALIQQAKDEGVAVTAETCPHYLTFSAEEIADGATEFKCAPPIRQRGHRDALWEALERGMLDIVVSDHSPSTPELKKQREGDFFAAWGGIASVQFGLAAVWDGARRRGVAAERVAQWMSETPARLFGLGSRKGRIADGYDADLVAWDPEGVVEVEPGMIRHRHKLTPYLGRRLHGKVRATFVGGRIAYIDDAQRAAELTAGRLLTRDTT
jgi:allantoinase